MGDGVTFLNISVVALTNCRYTFQQCSLYLTNTWKAHLYKTSFKARMARTDTELHLLTPVVRKHTQAANTHSHKRLIAVLVESLIRGGKCMWYYGNEVCRSSMLDAEVEMLDAEWMCRITKNRHTRTHTHTFVLEQGELFKMLSRLVCTV